MTIARHILLFSFLLMLLLFISQEHSNLNTRTGIEEIHFMAPGGPIAGALADVIHQFEDESQQAHAVDPSKPIYRVISGQSASRDQTADPTRFIISLAGGTPPDIIVFDRFAIAEWATRGAFEPLNGFLAADLAAKQPDAINPDEFYPSAWDEVVIADSTKRQTGLCHSLRH